VRALIGIDPCPMAAAIVAAVDRQTANTGGAHLSEGDLFGGRVADINTYISKRGASVPGARELRFDALVRSPLPDQLAALGYDVVKTGTTERILAHAVAQRFLVVRWADPGDRGLD
jgi:hypothetical protein